MTRPLLLLHGALGSSQQFDAFTPALKEAGFECLRINFSGHGGAAFADSFGIEKFAFEALRFLRERDIFQADIFGYSMGGYVGLWMAASSPSTVRRVVTLGTKFNWTPDNAAKEVRKLDPEKILEKVPAFADVLRERHHPLDWKELLRRTATMMIELGNRPLLTEMELATIQQPVLITIGDKDDMADPPSSERTAKALPRGSFKLMEDTPHALEKARTRDLVNILRDFLAD
ncbi:MAG TPA: alpha/beta fold hydrolase [Chryseosolibacter sp.]|nr:alpha/beta fold hydrolase [Chryseosolibacter sp.]